MPKSDMFELDADASTNDEVVVRGAMQLKVYAANRKDSTRPRESTSTPSENEQTEASQMSGEREYNKIRHVLG